MILNIKYGTPSVGILWHKFIMFESLSNNKRECICHSFFFLIQVGCEDLTHFTVFCCIKKNGMALQSKALVVAYTLYKIQTNQNV